MWLPLENLGASVSWVLVDTSVAGVDMVDEEADLAVVAFVAADLLFQLNDENYDMHVLTLDCFSERSFFYLVEFIASS